MKILVTESNKEKIKKELDAIQIKCRSHLLDVYTIYYQADKLKKNIKRFVDFKDIDSLMFYYCDYVQSDMPKNYKYQLPTTCFKLEMCKSEIYLVELSRCKSKYDSSPMPYRHQAIQLSEKLKNKIIDNVKNDITYLTRALY